MNPELIVPAAVIGGVLIGALVAAIVPIPGERAARMDRDRMTAYLTMRDGIRLSRNYPVG